jgi:hypothetical protein
MREREIGLTKSQIELEVDTQLLSVKTKTDDAVAATNENLLNKNSNSTGSILQLNDAADEFFDVPDEAEYELDEAPWFSADSVTSSVGFLFHLYLSIFVFCPLDKVCISIGIGMCGPRMAVQELYFYLPILSFLFALLFVSLQ